MLEGELFAVCERQTERNEMNNKHIFDISEKNSTCKSLPFAVSAACQSCGVAPRGLEREQGAQPDVGAFRKKLLGSGDGGGGSSSSRRRRRRRRNNYLMTTLTLVSPGAAGVAAESDIAAGASASAGG
jgi:hypothetical protein